ncbi:hypothetical protein AB0M28_37740 [Streptomyces sp. NPDC051940]|uniref:hypothetical protein n=1 Tax=Streptomyces sp. NPDC051940 TaxID=3155675 RepID=UPI0034177EBA
MTRTATIPVPVSLLTTLVLAVVTQDPSLLTQYLPAQPTRAHATAAAPCTPGSGRSVADSAGFTLCLPAHWARDEERRPAYPDVAVVTYREPGAHGITVKVFEVCEPTLRDSAERAERQRRRTLDGYRTLARTSAADRVTTTTGYGVAGHGVRGVDVRFRTAGGASYAVVVTGPEDRWPAQRELSAAVVSGFRVTGG